MLASTAAFLVCFGVLVLILRRTNISFGLDVPNHRSMHVRPVPRLGGLGLLAGVESASVLLGGGSCRMMVWSGGLLALFSLYDDVKSLSVSVRLAGQLFLAASAAWYLLYPLGGMALLVLCILAIAWSINLYNFMDGLDGLAGGMALIGFGFMGIAGYLAGNMQIATACAVVASAALAFLCFNIHPARLFMGDAGSTLLGFLAATFSLIGWRAGVWPIFMPMVVFSPFLVDATYTLLRRALRGEAVWQAHREHLYQKMVRMGYSQPYVTTVAYVLMLVCGGLALCSLNLGLHGLWWLAGGMLGMYLMIIAAVERRWHLYATNA